MLGVATLFFGDVKLPAESACRVRDLWKRETFGSLHHSFVAQVPSQGTVVVRIPPDNAGLGSQRPEAGEPALRFEVN
jgi:hypothetical protein